MWLTSSFLASVIQAGDEQAQRGFGECPHVLDAIVATGLQRDRAFERTADGDATVAGGVAVWIAGGPGRAGLGDAPVRR